jgi:hypothetical protein
LIQRPIFIEHATPWLVSSASGFYILARARRLSLAEASDAPLIRFLFRQSDLVLMLCGCPAIWYFARNHRKSIGQQALHGSQALAIHQLRQVFTALMLGTGLLARKAAGDTTASLATLALRLNRIAHDGARILDDLGDAYPSELLDQHNTPVAGHANGDGLGA